MNINDSSSSSAPSTSQVSANLENLSSGTHQSNSQESGEEQSPESSADSPKLLLGFQPKAIWPIAILVMLAALGIVGWKAYQSLRPESALGQEESSPTRLPVRVTEATVGLAQQWVFDEGVVTAVRRRVLKFETNGTIEFIAKVDGRDLRAGDTVSQGELLATIDDRTEIVSIETAEADLEVSIRQQDQAQASLLQAKADFDKAQSDLNFAKAELVRYQQLFEQGAVSESDRDVYVNSEEQAAAELRVAEQGIRSAEDDVRSAEATIEASQARLRETKVELEDTQLVSPIDGIVAYINIREGEYWDAQRISTGTDLDTLAETAPIVVIEPQFLEVELELQADEAQAIRSGQQAQVVLAQDVSAAEAAGATNDTLLDMATQQGSSGKVFAVSPTQTPGGRGVEVSIRNFSLVRNLQVGGRVYAWIEAAANPTALMLPLGSLLAIDQKFYAFVVDESSGTVERREVQRGIEGLTGIEILSGIDPGELVVTEGIKRLVDGTLVEIVSETAAL